MKTDRPPTESGFRLVVEVLSNLEEDNGWTMLATTVSTEAGPDAEILQALNFLGLQQLATEFVIGNLWDQHPDPTG